MVYINKTDSLVYHDWTKQKVFMKYCVNRIRQIKATREFSVAGRAPNSRTLRTSLNQEILFIWNDKNSITVVTDLTHMTQFEYSRASSTTSRPDSGAFIADFEPIGNDRFGVLWSTGDLEICRVSHTGYEVIRSVNTLSHSQLPDQSLIASKLAICSRQRFVVVSLSNRVDSSRHSLLLYTMDAYCNLCLKTIQEFQLEEYERPDSMLDHMILTYTYCPQFPVLFCSSSTSKSAQIYHLSLCSFSESAHNRNFFMSSASCIRGHNWSIFCLQMNGLLKILKILPSHSIQTEMNRNSFGAPEPVPSLKASRSRPAMVPKILEEKTSLVNNTSRNLNLSTNRMYRRSRNLTPTLNKTPREVGQGQRTQRTQRTLTPSKSSTFIYNEERRQFMRVSGVHYQNGVSKQHNLLQKSPKPAVHNLQNLSPYYKAEPRVGNPLNFSQVGHYPETTDRLFQVSAVRFEGETHRNHLQNLKNLQNHQNHQNHLGAGLGFQKQQKQTERTPRRQHLYHLNENEPNQPMERRSRKSYLKSRQKMVKNKNNINNNIKKRNLQKSKVQITFEEPDEMDITYGAPPQPRGATDRFEAVYDLQNRRAEEIARAAEENEKAPCNILNFPPHEVSINRGFVFNTPRYDTKAMNFMDKETNVKKKRSSVVRKDLIMDLMDRSQINEDDLPFYHKPEAEYKPWSVVPSKKGESNRSTAQNTLRDGEEPLLHKLKGKKATEGEEILAEVEKTIVTPREIEEAAGEVNEVSQADDNGRSVGMSEKQFLRSSRSKFSKLDFEDDSRAYTKRTTARNTHRPHIEIPKDERDDDDDEGLEPEDHKRKEKRRESEKRDKSANKKPEKSKRGEKNKEKEQNSKNEKKSNNTTQREKGHNRSSQRSQRSSRRDQRRHDTSMTSALTTNTQNQPKTRRESRRDSRSKSKPKGNNNDHKSTTNNPNNTTQRSSRSRVPKSSRKSTRRSKYSKIKEAIKQATTIKTPFQIGIDILPLDEYSGYILCENEKESVCSYQLSEDYNNFTYDCVLKEGSFFDSIYSNHSRKIYLINSEDGACSMIDPRTFKKKDMVQITPPDLPNKTFRVTQDQKTLVVNDANVLKFFSIEKRKIKKINMEIKLKRSGSKRKLQSVEDFWVGDESILIATTNGKIHLVFYDIESEAWEVFDKKDINGDLKKDKRLQITAMAVSSDGKHIAVSTVVDEDEDCRLKKVIVFKQTEDDELQLLYEHDFGHQPPNSLYSYLNFELSFEGKPLLLAFQCGDSYFLDAYLLDKSQLKVLHQQKNFHATDFSAIRMFNKKLFSLDFEGKLRIIDFSKVC